MKETRSISVEPTDWAKVTQVARSLGVTASEYIGRLIHENLVRSTSIEPGLVMVVVSPDDDRDWTLQEIQRLVKAQQFLPAGLDPNRSKHTNDGVVYNFLDQNYVCDTKYLVFRSGHIAMEYKVRYESFPHGRRWLVFHADGFVFRLAELLAFAMNALHTRRLSLSLKACLPQALLSYHHRSTEHTQVVGALPKDSICRNPSIQFRESIDHPVKGLVRTTEKLLESFDPIPQVETTKVVNLAGGILDNIKTRTVADVMHETLGEDFQFDMTPEDLLRLRKRSRILGKH